MSRPHEDRERHTLVDHRPGGEPVTFEIASWFAVEVAHVKRSRIDAARSAYESMIEHRPGASRAPRDAAIFTAATGREVLVLCSVGGHEQFLQLASAWDEHHRVAERHAVTESRSLKLYRVSRVFGEMSIDPASSDAYIIERIARDRKAAPAATGDVTAALGCRGGVILQSDDGNRSINIYRFEHADQFTALRGSSGAHAEHMHPVKTFCGSYENA